MMIRRATGKISSYTKESGEEVDNMRLGELEENKEEEIAEDNKTEESNSEKNQ